MSTPAREQVRALFISDLHLGTRAAQAENLLDLLRRVDAETGEIVIGGLSMPHSPRVYGGKLWVLNSGTGELSWVEPAKKAADAKFHVVAFCPGFVRGLAFHGKYAFVGLSKPRYERFEGLALDRKLAETDSEP